MFESIAMPKGPKLLSAMLGLQLQVLSRSAIGILKHVGIMRVGRMKLCDVWFPRCFGKDFWRTAQSIPRRKVGHPKVSQEDLNQEYIYGDQIMLELRINAGQLLVECECPFNSFQFGDLWKGLQCIVFQEYISILTWLVIDNQEYHTDSPSKQQWDGISNIHDTVSKQSANQQICRIIQPCLLGEVLGNSLRTYRTCFMPCPWSMILEINKTERH